MGTGTTAATTAGSSSTADDEDRKDVDTLLGGMVTRGGTWGLVHAQVEAGSSAEAAAIARRLGGWSAQLAVASALGIGGGSDGNGGAAFVQAVQPRGPAVVDAPLPLAWYDALAAWQWALVVLGGVALLVGLRVGWARRGSDKELNCCQRSARRAPTKKWGNVDAGSGADGAPGDGPSPPRAIVISRNRLASRANTGAEPFSNANPIFGRTTGTGAGTGVSGGHGATDENRVRM